MGGLSGLIQLYCLATAWVFSRRPPAAVGHLMEIPPNPDQFPVTVSYGCDSTSYGADAGVVTILGPWMTFQGLESEFAFQAGHVISRVTPSAQPTKWRRRSQASPITLKCEVGDRVFHVRITPFDHVDGIGTGYIDRFKAAILDWQRQPGVEGRRTLPPIHPLQRTIRRSKGWLNAFLAVMVATFIGSLGYLIAGPKDEWIACWVVCGLAVLVLEGVAAWIAHRDWNLLRGMSRSILQAAIPQTTHPLEAASAMPAEQISLIKSKASTEN